MKLKNMKIKKTDKQINITSQKDKDEKTNLILINGCTVHGAVPRAVEYGSAFIFCGSGSSYLSQCGSGSSCILKVDQDPQPFVTVPVAYIYLLT